MKEDISRKNKQLVKLNEYHMPKINTKKHGSSAHRDSFEDEKRSRSNKSLHYSEDKKFERLQADVVKIESKVRQADDLDK